MKRWRVVHLASPEAAEAYLNGLSLQPDQVKGLFSRQEMSGQPGGVMLVCWLNAQQQRIEELQRRPLDDEDSTAQLAATELALWEPEEEAPHEGPRARPRRGDDDEVGG